MGASREGVFRRRCEVVGEQFDVDEARGALQQRVARAVGRASGRACRDRLARRAKYPRRPRRVASDSGAGGGSRLSRLLAPACDEDPCGRLDVRRGDAVSVPAQPSVAHVPPALGAVELMG